MHLLHTHKHLERKKNKANGVFTVILHNNKQQKIQISQLGAITVYHLQLLQVCCDPGSSIALSLSQILSKCPSNADDPRLFMEEADEQVERQLRCKQNQKAFYYDELYLNKPK